MKYILFFILCALSAQSQTTTKRFVLAPDGVSFMEITRITEDDGRYSEVATIPGPAVALASDQADKVEAIMRDLAVSAYRVSFTKRTISEAAQADSVVTAVSGVSPLKAIQDRHQSELLKPGWTIDQGAGLGFQQLVFTVNASGNLRFSIAGAATKPATIYGAVIRLRNYPSSPTDTDFYLSENGNQYFSLPNRNVKIKRP